MTEQIKDNYYKDSQLVNFINNNFDKFSGYEHMGDFFPFEIILNNLHIPWDWEFLSERTDLTMDILRNNINLNWDFERLSYNRNLTFDVVLKNLELPWDWETLSWHPNLTPDIYLDNLALRWDWKRISQNRNTTFDIVFANPELPWNWSYLCRNRNMTFGILQTLLRNEDIQGRLRWDLLTMNENMTPEIIFNNVDLPWDWSALSSNKNFTTEVLNDISRRYKWLPDRLFRTLSEWSNATLEEVLRNLDIKWNICLLTHRFGFAPQINGLVYKDWLLRTLISEGHNHLPFDMILKNLDKNWNWTHLSLKTDFRIVLNNLNLPWDWSSLSLNESITPEIVSNNLSLPWLWHRICQNPNFTFHDLIKFEHVKFRHLSRNPNITLDVVENNIDEDWDMNDVICNRKFAQDRNVKYETIKDVFIRSMVDRVSRDSSLRVLPRHLMIKVLTWY